MAFFASCKKKDTLLPEKKEPEKIVYEYGFKLNDFDVKRDTIERGETFGKILGKENLAGRTVDQIVAIAKDSIKINTIRAGKPYVILRSKDTSKKLQAFIYQTDKLSYFLIDLRDTILARKKLLPISFKKRWVCLDLKGSLSNALRRAKIDAGLAARVTKIFSWSSDLPNIKKATRFVATFTERYINDSVYNGIDDLDGLCFEYKGKRMYAFAFIQDTLKPKLDYYDDKGNVLKNMFLKAPLEKFSLTSKFSKSRFHPILHIWKNHGGTDFAAPRGTPILSTANGIVEETGYSAGNGNFVKVKHDAVFATQYLHMSKILVRRGQTITQGQVIGKVGSTGLATGPHVCYRFWYKGKEVDFKKIKLPSSVPIEEKYKARYLAQIIPVKKELDVIMASTSTAIPSSMPEAKPILTIEANN
jgi:murein DD-endopeptidase MepM/ murein hydrolase activator NlpD